MSGLTIKNLEKLQAQNPKVLGNGDVLKVPELLPGWELAVNSIWASEFD